MTDMTYNEVLKKGRMLLEDAGTEDAAVDAEVLFEYVFEMNRASRILYGNDIALSDKVELYYDLIERRRSRVPVQQITGTAPFYGYIFNIDENVLIPRFDTEVLVELILKREKEKTCQFLDMCTGSGCILISLLNERKWHGTGVDISDEALMVAASNKDKYKLTDRCVIYKSDLYENVTGQFDFIVSNPPYIRKNVIDSLDPEVKNHEPLLALDGGEDGLDFYRKIIDKACEYLKEKGRIYFEIGFDQGKEVSDILLSNGYTDIEVIKDLAGLDRVVTATLSQ